MKKLIALLTITLLSASCSVLRSPYLTQTAYWATLASQATIAAADQARLAYEATKNGKDDSAQYYSANVVTLGFLAKQYTDSLLYYVNKK